MDLRKTGREVRKMILVRNLRLNINEDIAALPDKTPNKQKVVKKRGKTIDEKAERRQKKLNNNDSNFSKTNSNYYNNKQNNDRNLMTSTTSLKNFQT